jgi:acetyl-CoA carboxylase biotin carboxyl carrier protein
MAETLLNAPLRNPAAVALRQLSAGSLKIRRNKLATTVEAPMVGKILKIEKQVGEHVDEDDVVLVMEAMKMEIPIVAPSSGTIKEIKVTIGQAVEAEQALATIE